jgi:iron complex outermembrane receptor protein
MGIWSTKSMLASGAAMVCVMSAAPAMAQQRTFDVPAQSAAKAIPEFARQAGIQIIAAGSKLRGKRTSAVKGQMDVRAALQILIAGTGLRIATDNGATIALTEGNEGGAASSKPLSGEADAGSAAASDESADIVVTGTMIRGGTPASPVIQLGREEIDRSGATTVVELLRDLPQNSGTGQSQYNTSATGGDGLANGRNPGATTAANLRGLGSSSTLVLLNGHRLAPSGPQGAVDIASIPLSAIERVDILTDGASALYGSDAIGGVINFITKSKYDGAESSIRYGATSRNDGDQLSISQSFGRSWDSGNILLNYSYTDQNAILSSDRPYSNSVLKPPITLLPEQETHSGLFTGRQQITDGIAFVAQGFYTQRDSFTKLNLVDLYADLYGTETQYGFTAGADFDISSQWTGSLAGTLASDKVRQIGFQTNVNTGVKTTFNTPQRNQLRELTLDLNGTLFRLPGGDVKAAFGGSLRQEKSNISSVPDFSRNISAVYGELQIPIIGSVNSIPAVERLMLSAEARYEHYSDFGNAFSPKVGIIYEPVRGLRLRSTWGRAFRAPNPFESFSPEQLFILGIPAGLAPGAPFNTVYRLGGNQTLKPERSSSFSVGLDVDSVLTSGLSMSVNYYDIVYKDRIQAPVADLFGAYTDPLAQQFIQLNPSTAALQAIVNSVPPARISDFTGGAPLTSIRYLIDLRNQNLAKVHTNGADVTVAFKMPISKGNLAFSLNANKIFSFDVQGSPAAPMASQLGLAFRVPSFRARAGSNITTGPWSASFYVNYVSGSTNVALPVPQPVSSWTTGDLQISYNFERSTSPVLAGLKISLTALNFTDEDPPFLLRRIYAVNYDSVYANPRGRFVSLAVSKRW